MKSKPTTHTSARTTTTTTAAARKTRLAALFFMCLALTTAASIDIDIEAEAAGLSDNNITIQQNGHDILIFQDGQAYDYCQASHPTVDTYPNPQVEGAVLSNVQLFIRHGDRTSQSIYRTDNEVTWECSKETEYNSFDAPATATAGNNFFNASMIANQIVAIPRDSPFAQSIWKGSCIPGQLTPKGSEQQKSLGRALREIYVDRFKFLPEEFHADKVFVRSTDFWRTRQSAISLMTGLYTTKNKSSPPPRIQLTTLPFEVEYLIFNEKGQCPRINQLKDQITKRSRLLQKLYKSIARPIQDAAKIIDPPNTLTLGQVNDFVLPRVCHHMPLPCTAIQTEDENGGGRQEMCIDGEATSEELAIHLSKETAEIMRDSPQSLELLQVGFGPAVAMIRKNLVRAMDKNPDQALFSLYSGHDTTITPLLGVLDSLDMRWPPYASNVLIELWETPSKEQFVRALYNNRVVETKSNWCDLSWCPLQTFFQHLGHFLPGDDYLQKCQLQPDPKTRR
ncbi:Acid phosphatase-like protein 2 [Mortierella sp. NVP41]|nr:Acid phosphatase-like protein 2 [Mortierella sp. NVP41]